MQAIILAAGMGKRLKELTHNNTKCMVKVNGVTLIERMLHQIDSHNLSQIVIVVGYMGQALIDYIGTLDIKTPIKFINNPIYDKTNNIYSLYLAKDELLSEDTVLFESDLIFEDAVLDSLINDPRETLTLVDKYKAWMDGTCVKLGEEDSIEEFVPGKNFKYADADKYYKTVNLYKFSKKFSETHYVPFLEAYSKALGNNEYYEQVLKVITMLDNPEIKAKRLSGELWYEIDDVQDLDIAESMFKETEEEMLECFNARYGGYWRYPELTDFCYLVNPYFPPKKMIDEMQASFVPLLTQYPSGMGVNSLVAGRNFGIRKENIVVGNGAAELIKALMEQFTGTTGFVRPTFEEYPHRYNEENSVSFYPDNENYTYTAEDLMNFFGDKNIKNLVVVNPDNPSGNYIKKADVLLLADWAKERNINLLMDESFVDFATEEDSTLISQEILGKYTNLYVMKSLSKSMGVPGLRLGVLCSGNIDVIKTIKKDVAIWNINSFGEFYMQIFEKYRKDYVKALERFRVERTRFAENLSKLPNVRVIPSEANYIMVELTGDITAGELCRRLLKDYWILAKNLSSKISRPNYLRIAIRNDEDNDKLIAALKEILG